MANFFIPLGQICTVLCSSLYEVLFWHSAYQLGYVHVWYIGDSKLCKVAM